MVVSAALNVQNVRDKKSGEPNPFVHVPIPPNRHFVCTNFFPQVYSPFELDHPQPAPLGSVEVPGVHVVDWESLDKSVWSTCKSLLLLQPEVIEASMSIPFLKDQHAKDAGFSHCSRLCEMKSSSEKDKKNAVVDELQKLRCPSMHRNPDSSVDLHEAVTASSDKLHLALLCEPTSRVGDTVQPPAAPQRFLSN
jgi:hypothetical protein